MELTERQRHRRAEIRQFVEEHISLHANEWDRQERIPTEVIQLLAGHRYLGALLPVTWGGPGFDAIEFGLLNEEVGRGCSSVRSLLTVQSMVLLAILRWGSDRQKETWLERLGQRSAIAAFALTEPDAGSDIMTIKTEAVAGGRDFLLSGSKTWISFGQVADVFLVFTRGAMGHCAFLVEKETPGLTIVPLSGLLGTRASMMAELRFDRCRVPETSLVGAPGFGLSHVASSALDCGRYSVAWGCVGIIQACLESCLVHTSRRRQFGSYIKDHQLVQRMTTQMVVGAKAARLLCHHAGCLRQTGDPASILETSIAKYFSSRAAADSARDAVQLHGARGCSTDCAAQRLFRDAKVMEIIEGSNEIQEITIARNVCHEANRSLNVNTSSDEYDHQSC
jgi:glutaryl-CoA dehydrogenase (non-decarboxylating)